jgi:hypothetical protein
MRTVGIILVALLLALLAALALWAWLRECGVGVGAGKKAADGAAWQAEVELEQLTERNPDYEALRIKVVPRDSRGREVETPGVQFQLDTGLPPTAPPSVKMSVRLEAGLLSIFVTIARARPLPLTAST